MIEITDNNDGDGEYGYWQYDVSPTKGKFIFWINISGQLYMFIHFIKPGIKLIRCYAA